MNHNTVGTERNQAGGEEDTPSWEEVKAAKADAEYNRSIYPGSDREASAQRVVDSMPPEIQQIHERIDELHRQGALATQLGNSRAGIDAEITRLQGQLDRLNQ
jgi:hypothetical protein